MASNQESAVENDGAILFTNNNDNKENNDPFQNLSNTTTSQPKMTPSHSHTTQQSGTFATVAPSKQPEETVAGDASSLFGGNNGADNDTNGLFGTSDSLFPNGQADHGDPFFSQQQPQPQETAATGHEQQYSQQPGYDNYAYPNTEHQQQGQYDSQQTYGQQQQQYDTSSYYQYSQPQQQQDQYGQYDSYANQQYQQQPQQNTYAYQPTTSTSTTTQAIDNNTNATSAVTANTNYYDQSSYDPQQYNNYYANYNQSGITTSTTVGATQTQPVESQQQQQYSPYDPNAQQQQQYDQQYTQQQQYGAYDANATQQQQQQQQPYDPYNPAAQQQQDTYSQYSQSQYQQQDDTYSQYSHQQYHQQPQPQQDDTYSQYTQQDQQQYAQYNYYGTTDQANTGTATTTSEIQSTQQDQYAPFDTGAQVPHQQALPPSQQHQQEQHDPFFQKSTEASAIPPPPKGPPKASGSDVQQIDQNQQPPEQQDAFAPVDLQAQQQQDASKTLEGGPQHDSLGPSDNTIQQQQQQPQPQQPQQQEQEQQKDLYATGQDGYGQYNQYNDYAAGGYDAQTAGGASEVQVSQQEEYTSFDTGVQSQQEQLAQFETGVQSQQEQFAQFETGVQSQQEQFAQFETGVSEVEQQTHVEEEYAQFDTGVYKPTKTDIVENKDYDQQPSVDVQAPLPPPSSSRQSQEQTREPPKAVPPPPKQQQKVVPPPPAAASVPQKAEQEQQLKGEVSTSVIEPVTATTPEANNNNDQVVPSSYDPYQSYTNNYTLDQSTTSASVYTPSKPDEIHAVPYVESSSSIIGRSSIEQNRAETSTVQSGSMLSRLASPQLEQLLPCPDPACEGENKCKAKFCCECGRPLTSGASRSVTPIIQPSQQQTLPVVPTQDNYSPYDAQQPQQSLPPPPSQVQPGRNIYTPDSYAATEQQQEQQQPLMMDTEGVPAYYDTETAAAATADVYQQQQQLDQQAQQYPPDPLGRSKGCPVVTFGFGGKMCVMFPQTVQRFTAGYDGAITKAMPSAVRISKLKDVIGDQNPTVASLAQFVGPVLNDPKGSTKNKKKEVLTYMDKRIEELTVALQQQSNNNNLGEYHQAENRISLWRLLKTMIENDGTIGDGDKMDNAVRALLQPIKKGEEENDQGNFSVPAYAQVDGQQQDEDAENRERSKKVLNKLESYLVNGDRAGAVEYAMQEDLWAHALILSSCVDKDVWKKVVTNFAERELSQSAGETPRQDRFNVTGDKQALRVLYSLFAGSGASSMSEFLPAAAPQQRLGTPFGVPAQAPPPQATEEQLQEWQITLTLILANRTPRDTEAITSLGDILRTHGWLDAAHICYLVSPQSSLHSGIDAPHVRLTLIGAEGTTAFSDLDAYYLTELYEFALSTKQGGASSLPFLQGYKLVHAWWLADFGYLNEAQRYCEAIADAIKGYTKGSPYLHRQLLENLKEFSELCEAASGQSIGDTKSWVKNKLSKNMLESMWGSFEGKFNKFVSGEDMPAEEPPVRKSTEIMGTPYDAAKDGPPARSASAFDFRNAARSSIGPESLRRAATPTANMPSEAYGNRRSSSPGVRGLQQTGTFAHAFTPLSHYGESQMQEQPQQEELSQTGAVMDEQQQQQQQAPDNYGYGQQSGYGGYGYGAQPSNATTSPFGYTGGAQQATNATTSPFGHGGSTEQQPQSYYGQESYNNSSAPYGEQQLQQQDQQNGYGGYDPNAGSGWYGGDQQQQQQTETYQPEQTSSYEPPVASSYEPSNQEDNDLGFGNSSLTKSKPPSTDTTQENQTQSKAPEPISQENPTDKPHEADEKKTDEGKHGWGLFSFFSRSSTPSNASQNEKKAVKANLGEESAFYYDEKEKRWVNKNAPATPAAPSLPPPPKATSSPAPSNRNTLSTPPPPSSSTSGPPVSTASTPGQKQPLMMRSGSTPPTTTTPPARAATSPPPTAPPSGGARRSRKPMRSRYVDVFNQPGN